jgi:hypothetical protein
MSVPFGAIEHTDGVFEVSVTGNPELTVTEDEIVPGT